MNTAFKTGPGLYAAYTNEKNKTVPPDKIRLYLAEVQAVDIHKHEGAMDDVKFMLLPAMAENKPEVARALINLYQTLGQNMAFLKAEAKKQN
jgi:hypothetical protein